MTADRGSVVAHHSPWSKVNKKKIAALERENEKPACQAR